MACAPSRTTAERSATTLRSFESSLLRKTRVRIRRFSRLGHRRPAKFSRTIVTRAIGRRRPLCADSVEKVENRTTPKIPRKLIFWRAYRCKASWRRYDGPWSILSETMRSLTSPRAKRISGSEKFRTSPKKDFFNTIGAKRPFSSSVTISRRYLEGNLTLFRNALRVFARFL